MKLVNLRAGEDQHQAWKTAAATAGLTFSEWTRAILDDAASTNSGTTRVNHSRSRTTATTVNASGKRSYQPDFKAKAKKRR